MNNKQNFSIRSTARMTTALNDSRDYIVSGSYFIFYIIIINTIIIKYIF